MNKTLTIGFALIINVVCISCNNIYKAGNLVSLDYPVETRLRSALIQRYCDTLIIKYGYNVPKKWLIENKLVEFDSINHIRIYFKNDPEEMYLLSFGGMLVLNDVYNPQIRDGEWVARKDLISNEQETRIKMRFKKEILDRVEAMAKQDGLPDSIIYKQ